ncbi:MAG: lysophospholipid acyltransferase family protein [Pseudobdellovibrio sp.]
MSHVRGFLIGFIVWVIYKILSQTWKINIIEPEELKQRLSTKKPFILAHFHQDELALLTLTPIYNIATMSSKSKDGEIMATVLRLHGVKVSRGSSSRGGVSALKGLIEYCRKGSNSCIAIDGPRGPIYEPKPGVFELSRLLKSPIYAGGVSCDHAWHFPKSWNKTFLPKPFSKITVVWNKAFEPITKGQDPRSAELAKELQNQLFAARQQATYLLAPTTTKL